MLFHDNTKKRLTLCQVAKIAIFLIVFTVSLLVLIVITRTALVATPSVDSHCLMADGGSNTDVLSGSSQNNHKAITAQRGVFERFQQALHYRTVTRAPKNYSANETLEFINFLKTSMYFKKYSK